MPLIRLSAAFLVLVSISLFIFMNTRDIAGGSGYFFLLLSLVGFLVMVFSAGDLQNLLLVKRSTVLLVLFVFYFLVKFYFESGSSYLTHTVSLGTNSGILFSGYLGFAVSQAMLTTYDLRQVRSVSGLIYVLAIIYILLVVVLMYMVMQVHGSNLRSDILLIEDQLGRYQRVGDLLIVQMLIVASLGSVLLASSRKPGILSALPAVVLVLAITAMTGYISQAVGSNKGLVVSGVIALIFIVVAIVASMNHSANRRIGLLNIILGSLGLKLVIAALVAGLGLFLFSDIVISQLGIDSSMLRITGFGSGESSSVESRNEMFVDYFIPHFSYSPLFGNTQVERLTTGEGTYVHSILSVFTHTGVFGGLIFTALLFSLYVDITANRRSQYDSLYNNNQYGLFRLLVLAAMVVMCGFVEFFTWMPLWFTMALTGDWFRNRRHELPGKKRRRRRVPTHGTASMGR